MKLLNSRFLIPIFFGMTLLLQPITMGDFAFAQYLSPEELDKERIQLEKQRKIFENNLQTIQLQINELSSILNTLKTNNISQDKLEDIEEQLEELYHDKSKLEKSEIDLLEREEIFKKQWNDLHPQTSPNTVTSESALIPSWFKSNAQWWNEGLISDSDMVNALESLIIQDIIPLDNFIKASTGIEPVTGVPKDNVTINPMGGIVTRSDVESATPVDRSAYITSPNYGDPESYSAIPSYQKDVFRYWSEGQVSDSEIISSIGHLMSQGIINSAKIQTEISERQVRFDQKMKELDSALDSDSKFMDKLDEYDGSVTVMNPDGSKTVTFEDKTSTTFFKDGSRETRYPEGMMFDETDDGPVGWYMSGISLPKAEIYSSYTDGHMAEMNIRKLVTNSDGSRSVYEFKDLNSYESSDAFANAISSPGLVINSDITNSIFSKPAVSETYGGMHQLIPVTVMTIDGIQFPISQFTLWKWTGECDDAWHYHTPSGHAIAIDAVTGISDPDQENCGFGKVGEVFVGTSFMSQSEIDKFRDRTDFDPLENEAMMGGSDTGSNSVEDGPNTESDDTGLTSLEEPDDLPSAPDDPFDVIFPLDPNDSDGDGIPDTLDDHPNQKSTKFGTNGSGVPGQIISQGDLSISITGSEEFGSLIIEVGTDGDSKSVIIEIMGVEFEFEAGTIVELSFG